MSIGPKKGMESTVVCLAAIVTAFVIAKFGADDETMTVGAAVGDKLAGIFQHTTENAGDQVRVATEGLSSLVLGGNVVRGDLITSDANGKGVAAAPASGVNNRVIGVAMNSGASGDIITVAIAPSSVQGA